MGKSDCFLHRLCSHSLEGSAGIRMGGGHRPQGKHHLLQVLPVWSFSLCLDESSKEAEKPGCRLQGAMNPLLLPYHLSLETGKQVGKATSVSRNRRLNEIPELQDISYTSERRMKSFRPT